MMPSVWIWSFSQLYNCMHILEHQPNAGPHARKNRHMASSRSMIWLDRPVSISRKKRKHLQSYTDACFFLGSERQLSHTSAIRSPAKAFPAPGLNLWSNPTQSWPIFNAPSYSDVTRIHLVVFSSLVFFPRSLVTPWAGFIW